MIDPKLLEILACPQDKQSLEDHGDYLVNPRLGVAYPIQDGIPVLLVDESVKWPLTSA
ncbi:Trm112 family protein [uncultured Corynebacterium sp.]|uniref:Trm112 family protein n=1 Tax=uncultured Corynebacterium sp. TaxID=159447 RepID=UPI0025D8D664|nr:Trm112 family protein [uncultured Corynebacterium sp.]